MPRPRTHDLDRLLDTAERLIAEGGPERLTIRRLATESGMSNGAIYHAFGSLATLRGRLWLRAATEFLELQKELVDDALGELPGLDAAVNAVVAAADTPAAFANRRPAAARMLMTVRRDQLLGPELPTELADELLGLDRRLVSLMRRLAQALWDRRDGPGVDVITTCVVDLPTALFRRELTAPTADGTTQISADARRRLDAAVRAVLAFPPPDRRERPCTSPERTDHARAPRRE
ncbi:helix-turn-helix domain-containing protein [Saccharopolyspora elongata]|uniref:TetR/AcrR family transcriptional regulator n=1 Tax=Saccharopolyspora elongata TaxID=2530387 RepID=A0A4R4ZC32_9PSEU|nr:TetR/AcrR family transcriptional regulator [Saccharopolyspora elongata]TDD55991.1 TetR/AcrR family transcriptional regulator [Saccharopolyspora elongata]